MFPVTFLCTPNIYYKKKTLTSIINLGLTLKYSSVCIVPIKMLLKLKYFGTGRLSKITLNIVKRVIQVQCAKGLVVLT